MPTRALQRPQDVLVWRILQIIGLIFAIVGLLDMSAAWLPNQFGDPEWEFGTTSHFFDVVPLLGIGVAFLLAAAIATGRRWQGRLIAFSCLLIAVFMILAMLVYATSAPMAFKVITDPPALTQLKKAAAKTGIQALFYPFAMLWLAGAGWRATIGKRRG